MELISNVKGYEIRTDDANGIAEMTVNNIYGRTDSGAQYEAFFVSI